MLYGIMNVLHTRIVVCCYRGRVGTNLSVLWVAYLPVFVFVWLLTLNMVLMANWNKEISSRNKAQVNKTPYFSWPSTPCLGQQPHESKNRSIRHPQYTQIGSNSFTIAADNNTGMYIIHYSVMKSTTLHCWESNLDVYFKTTSSIACETRKQ